MQTYGYTLRPLSAFGTPLAGDTLFGQLCWTLLHQLGNLRLGELLQGYTHGRPFVVVADAVPAGHLPLPNVPSRLWASSENTDRKALKKKRWLPRAALNESFSEWQASALSDSEAAAPWLKQWAEASKHRNTHGSSQTERAQPHNTIIRQTGTTGEGQFAPYAMPQIWFHPAMQLDVHLVLDVARLSLTDLTAALDAIGATGFGRDASMAWVSLNASANPVQSSGPQTLHPTATSHLVPARRKARAIALFAAPTRWPRALAAMVMLPCKVANPSNARSCLPKPEQFFGLKRLIAFAHSSAKAWAARTHPCRWPCRKPCNKATPL